MALSFGTPYVLVPPGMKSPVIWYPIVHDVVPFHLMGTHVMVIWYPTRSGTLP